MFLTCCLRTPTDRPGFKQSIILKAEKMHNPIEVEFLHVSKEDWRPAGLYSQRFE